MNRELIALVRERAGGRCEFCHMPREFDDVWDEIDHIIPLVHHGQTVAENLALTCWPCNCHKGTNLSGIDPVRNRITRLFNPRRDKWNEHFEWAGAVLVGRTGIGRATVDVLRINDLIRQQIRLFVMEAGQFHPT